MSKVTYEEAKKALNEMYAVLNDSNRWNKHKDLLNEVLNQHKPPTFDEVVKAWKKSYGEHVVVTERDGTIMVEDGVSTDSFSYDDIDTHVRFFGSKGHIILNAIHLTIRYLQAKEKEND